MSESSTDPSLPFDLSDNSAFDALLDNLVSPQTVRPVPEVGDHIGDDDRFLLEEIIGRGGQGIVFLAQDLALNRKVAIKLVFADKAEDDRSWVRRCDTFDDETQLLAQLQNPNIVVIYDRGRWNDVPFLVMEHLSGDPLSKILKTTSPGIDFAVDVAFQIASGLKAAHGLGVVHRDLKPDNIIILNDDTLNSVRILDFGMAWLNPELSSQPENTLAISERRHGGTASYMSPEQWRCHDDQDHQTDIWALGVILAEMVTGQHPFQHNDLSFKEAILGQHRSPMNLGERECDLTLTRLINKCLEPDRQSRLQNIHIVLRELNKIKKILQARGPERKTRRGTSQQHEDRLPSSNRRRWILSLSLLLIVALSLVVPLSKLSGDRIQFQNQVTIYKHQIPSGTLQTCVLKKNLALSICLFGAHTHRGKWRPFSIFILVSPRDKAL